MGILQLSWGLLTSQAHRGAAQALVLHSEQQLQPGEQSQQHPRASPCPEPFKAMPVIWGFNATERLEGKCNSMLTKSAPFSQRVPASLFLSCPVVLPSLVLYHAAGCCWWVFLEAKGTCGYTSPGAAHGSSCGLVEETGVKDFSALLCIFCSAFKRTTHGDKAGLLSETVRAVTISHYSINQATDQHHFPPALEAAPANRHPLARGTAPGDPQPGPPVISDRFRQTTVLSQGTVP